MTPPSPLLPGRSRHLAEPDTWAQAARCSSGSLQAATVLLPEAGDTSQARGALRGEEGGVGSEGMERGGGFRGDWDKAVKSPRPAHRAGL